jgi:hypothetical protein
VRSDREKAILEPVDLRQLDALCLEGSALGVPAVGHRAGHARHQGGEADDEDEGVEIEARVEERGAMHRLRDEEGGHASGSRQCAPQPVPQRALHGKQEQKGPGDVGLLEGEQPHERGDDECIERERRFGNAQVIGARAAAVRGGRYRNGSQGEQSDEEESRAPRSLARVARFEADREDAESEAEPTHVAHPPLELPEVVCARHVGLYRSARVLE